MKYTKKDAAKDTNTGTKSVARNWHQAKEDAREARELTDRPATTPSKSAKNEPDLKAPPYNSYPQPKGK